MKLYFITVLLTFCIQWGSSVKIVALTHHGLSHYKTISLLGRELTKRGHQFTMVQLNYTVQWPGIDTHVVTTTLPHDFYDCMKIDLAADPWKNGAGFLAGIMEYLDALGTIALDVANDNRSMSLIENCDLILGEVGTLTTLIFAKKFNKPYIMVHSMHIGILKHGFRLPSSSAPDYCSFMPYPSSSFSQMFSFVAGYVTQAYFKSHLVGIAKNVGQKINVSDIPLQESSAIVITQYDPLLDYPQALHPHMFTPGIWVIEETKPLPTKYEQFIAKQKNGFILVSFGTIFTLHSDSLQVETNFIKKLSKLNYGFIISTKTNHTSLPGNALTDGNVPQPDLLAHPSIKLFVSHVGLLSTIEACYHGVPVLAVPRAADQFDNAHRIEYWMKMGRRVSFDDTEKICKQIPVIINDAGIRKNARRCATVMRSKPIGHARKRAVDIVEDFISWGYNASHLRPYVLDMPWYEYHMVDVWCTVVAMILIPYFLFKCCKNRN